jgi:hypothetical protein
METKEARTHKTSMLAFYLTEGKPETTIQTQARYILYLTVKDEHNSRPMYETKNKDKHPYLVLQSGYDLQIYLAL